MNNTTKTLLILSVSLLLAGTMMLLGSFNTNPSTTQSTGALVLTGSVASMPSNF